MRNRSVITKILALVMVVFYVLSMGGINVHTCSHTGNRYVTFLFEGISCADIHPGHVHEHHHDCASCCEEEHHDCDGEDGCCRNDSHLLQITGDTDHAVVVRHLTVDSPVIIIPQTPAPALFAVFSETESDLLLPDRPGGDILSSYCILRV